MNTLLPDSALEKMPGLSVRELKSLQAANILTVRDLLMRIPRRYEDRRCGGDMSHLSAGQTVCLRVHVYGAAWRFSYKRYFEVSAGADDDPMGNRLFLRWFNMPYVAKLLAVGMKLSIYGTVREYAGKLSIINPEFEVLEEEDAGHRLVSAAMGGIPIPIPAEAQENESVHTGRIVPIYRNISGMGARAYRALVWQVLSRLSPQSAPLVYDVAPSYPYAQAYRDIHFPANERDEKKARMRFALEECFLSQFRVAWRRRSLRAHPGQNTASSDAYMQELLASLPFHLTAAQQRCVKEIRADMVSPRQMNRLLQGDVGSGKTLVALCAMLLAVGSGKIAAMLAPTQILAEQHYRNFCRLLAHTDVQISLRTSGRVDDSDLMMETPREQGGSPRIIIGTHALLYPANRPENLGLAVVDEQHKFGVEQREKFYTSGRNPDILVMTATPIPRTLTLTLYGDLDVSVIDELPANRGEIITAMRRPSQMKRIIQFMREELDAGRQIYIVSPLVEESEKRDQASAVAEWERWRGIFPDVEISLLHGKLSADDKERVMRDFNEHRSSILVATTVVEVGVDVPNATIMLINDAESFGLSQLHQLRGRIGRGCHKSYCILLSKAKEGEAGYAKLAVMCRTLNGFEIAEEDFRLRGPGDVLGTAQSGLAGVQFSEWMSDVRLIYRANREANDILAKDPHLEAPSHAGLRKLVLNNK